MSVLKKCFSGKVVSLVSTLLFVALLLPGNLIAAEPKKADEPVKDILLATTTSLQKSGLLDTLITEFQMATGYEVKTLAMSLNQAMTLGELGEVDVLLVNSPEAEEKFMASGKGINRRPVMHDKKSAYHVIEVNPAKWPAVNSAGAKAFGEFLVSNDAQKMIGEFGKKKTGKPLFTPDAGKP